MIVVLVLELIIILILSVYLLVDILYGRKNKMETSVSADFIDKQLAELPDHSIVNTEYISDPKPKRERAKLFAVIKDYGGGIDIIEAVDKKDLQIQLDNLGFSYSIEGIFKGHSVNFKERKQITFE